MSDNRKDCDLCGLVVEIEGFELKTTDGGKHFCCEGCKGVNRMLHDKQVQAETADAPSGN